MKRSRLMLGLWGLGFALAAVLLLFLSPRYTSMTWITLGFAAAAFLSQMGLFYSRRQAMFLQYPAMMVSAAYLLAELVLCCVFALVPVSVKTGVLVHLLVLIAAWALLLSAALARNEIEKVQKRQKDHHIEL